MTQDDLNKIFTECDTMLSICQEIMPLQASSFEIEKIREIYEKLFDYSCPEVKDKFLAWMNKYDFWKTPASTRFHGNFESGLAVHTLQVIFQSLKFARPLLEDFYKSPLAKNFQITSKDIFIAALSHDFCKADSYEINYRNTKDYTGNWVKKAYYKTRDDIRSLGHGNESVLRLLEIEPSFINNRLLLEAVSRHMGFSDLSSYEEMNYSNFLENPLVILLQTADQTAASWYGN